MGLLPALRMGGVWYHRIGRFLVEETVDEETEILVVRFGSDAYFELAQKVTKARPVFAASVHVVVKVTETHAVLVSDERGIEEFSDQQRKELSLVEH